VRGIYLPGAYVSRPVIHGDHLYSGVCFGAKLNDYRMWQGRGFVTILNKDDQVISNPGGHAPEYENGSLKVLLPGPARLSQLPRCLHRPCRRPIRLPVEQWQRVSL